MATRAEHILARSRQIKDVEAERERQETERLRREEEKKYERIRKAEEAEEAEEERDLSVLERSGILEMLSELSKSIPDSELKIEKTRRRCYLRISTDGGVIVIYKSGYVEVEEEIEVLFFKKSRTIRRKNPIFINDKLVGRDGDIEELLSEAIAHPKLPPYQDSYNFSEDPCADGHCN